MQPLGVVLHRFEVSSVVPASPAAVWARVSTLKENEARSGTVVTVPWPFTVIVFADVAAAERPSCGWATPAIAEAARSTAASRKA